MSPKEKPVVLILALVILGAVSYLVTFAPLGTLGSANGQSYEVDRLSIIGFTSFCFAGGYLFVHCRTGKEARAEKRNAEPEASVWPPPPTEP